MNYNLKSRGIMLVISSPSGGGKTACTQTLDNDYCVVLWNVR
ncbi:hypothetical protein EMUR_03580 [Ehrlichia muris AS145]|uniref:Guanylate kinase n=1 Tax=Ehrlichia muris AS145 TaxID=1423892 RepID=V9R7D8_9RICK|nr:hypothetical protein EMUR_03580 [Ehrlichia muris AS145]